MYDFTNEPSPPTNVPYLIVCCIVVIFIVMLLMAYWTAYYDSPPIVAILALLMLNHLFMLLFEVPAYMEDIPNWACLGSIIGTTFFRLASYYWLIFVTRLVYREKSTPGRVIDLSKYVSINIIFTYIPSIVVTVLVLIVANISESQSELYCWRIIQQKTIEDYVVYLSCFVLPTLIALIAVVGYLLATFAIKTKYSYSLCIYFPLTAIPFICYDLVLRLMTFFGEWKPISFLQIPLVCSSLCHGVIFFFVIRNLSRGRRPTSSDITIQEQSNKSQIFVQAQDRQE